MALFWALALVLFTTTACLRPATSPDSWRYQQIAQNLAAGHGYSASTAAPYQPDLLRAPVYPAAMAAIVALTGPNWTLVRLLQAVLLSLLVPLAYWLARRCFDSATALVACALVATYPHYCLYSGALLSDGLACVLMAGAAVLLWLSLQGPTKGLVLLAGAACGLACLIKPVMLLFPVAAAILYVVHLRRAWLRPALLYLAGAVCVVLPWTARNYAVSGDFIPVTAGKGLMLYQMARYTSEGLTMQQYHEQVQSRDPRIQLAQISDDPAVTIALDQELSQDALKLIRERPIAYLSTILRTPVTIWLNLYGFADGTLAFSAKHLMVSLVYFCTAVVGLLLSRRRWRQAAVPLTFMIYLSVVHMPIWSEPRQSLPGRLFLLMFAAAALVQAWRWFQRPARPEGGVT